MIPNTANNIISGISQPDESIRILGIMRFIFENSLGHKDHNAGTEIHKGNSF